MELLQRAAPYELGLIAGLVPPYIRGQAYLQGKGEEAAEFQRNLEHRGSAPLSMVHALAHFRLARAYALSGDTAKAKSATKTSSPSGKTPTPTSPS